MGRSEMAPARAVPPAYDAALSSRRAPARSLRAAARCALFTACLGACGCTTWTSLHGGYGFTPRSDRSVAALEVRRARGGKLHSGYWLAGARVDGSDTQFDAEAHVGVMRPLRLSAPLTFVPSATLELARVSNIDGDWSGGALGPGLGAELVWWLGTDRRVHEGGALCMGGAEGFDCPRGCIAEDVTRHGLGFRAAAEYDIRLTPSYPRMNDWVVWFTVSATLAESERERECCYFDRTWPRRGDCTLAP